ncbi:methylated-DNA--[protein]-cysteine S-methyltransferase [Bdellovibrio bacteriovorus]|uniref:methylated-DNA--[protein]-cysteine S-methyltransferase n=1 Tax=Bdellovibrio bacteriovorus str. Tiberius TaxID=1069642 RepID=K7Z751_BDEBC|nr:methylated-DNA--[protein]-cysteine S-methyltransferase [Bdellovibrio bacteriovorus]AFY00089.1 6-O-methylguanine-DNA methyltransferase [Bdellovibrio bacteriovorus str. Tiberius]
MTDLEFKIFKVPSEFGEWLAAFEDDQLIFLGSYNAGKKLVEGDLASLIEKFYSVRIGSFQPAKWNNGNFWTTQHQIKLQGTEFQMKVWLELLKIPAGKTVTYSELAKKLRKGSAVRAVATAVGKNPISYWIPCHRVVGKGSNLLKYHWGPEVKEYLLIKEGVL